MQEGDEQVPGRGVTTVGAAGGPAQAGGGSVATASA